MADLSLAPPTDRNPLKAILIAAAVLALVAFAVFWLNPHKVATAQITQEQLLATHTQFGSLTPKDAAKMPGGMRVVGEKPAAGPAAGSEDNLYVIATVHLDNKLRLPVFITGATTTLADAQGAQAEGRTIAPRDVPQLEALYPQLKPMLPHPLADGEEAAPGQSAEGQVVLLFSSLNEQSWHAKKSATLTLDLAHQDPVTIQLP